MSDPLHAFTTVVDAHAPPGRRLAVKDNMDVAGTVRSDGLAPPHPAPATTDCPAVARLRAAGAVVVGKANLEELSFGATTRNRYWGTAANPWDTTRIAGGSSGGSAVAVAAGLADVALGTDTGGSLRNPASFCGVSALRPTHGRVPVDGVTPLAPEFDVVGPMARDAETLRRAFACLTGAPVDTAATLSGVRIGVPERFFYDDLEPAVAAALDLTRDVLRGAGARLTAVSLPGSERTPEAIAALLNRAAARLHGAYLGDPRVDEQIKVRLRAGLGVSLAEHVRAQQFRETWRRTVDAAFDTVDALLVPTTPFCAPAAGDDQMLTLSAAINRCNSAWSLTGGPALTLPCWGPGPLPVGLQLVGPAGADERLLGYGVALGRETDWATRRPALAART